VILESGNLESLVTYIHPEKGVHFSPHHHTSPTDLVFTSQAFVEAIESLSVHVWGITAGRGNEISFSIPDYVRKYFATRYFSVAPEIVQDTPIKRRSAGIFNLPEAFPDATIIEYHFPEVSYPEFQKWESLYLIFEELDGQWFLVGIAHGEWLI